MAFSFYNIITYLNTNFITCFFLINIFNNLNSVYILMSVYPLRGWESYLNVALLL